jgi:restriction system protein
MSKALAQDRDAVSKYKIVREVLQDLNRRGEATLRERRELLRRTVEFSNFDACWPTDQMKAKGHVASLREIVNQKDAFTRMNQERERERRERIVAAEAAISAEQQRLSRIRDARDKLYALFAPAKSQSERGKKLEDALNSVFAAYGVSVTGSFHLVGHEAEGVVEQIDGVIRLDGSLVFVEMKWYKHPVGKAEVSEHLVRLIGRAEARGLFISASDYTEPAVTVAREFLQHKLIALSHLDEFVRLLDGEGDLREFLVMKLDAALMRKDPYFRPLDPAN